MVIVMDQPGLNRHQPAEEFSKVRFNWSDVETSEPWDHYDDDP